MIHLYERRNGQEVEPLPLEELKDGFYKVEIVRKYDVRSLRQNALMWKWLQQLEKESHVGYTKDGWHDTFCQFFIPPVKKRSLLDRRKWVLTVRGTSDLKTVEFNTFLEKVRTAALTTKVGPIRLLYPEQVSFEAWLKTFN